MSEPESVDGAPESASHGLHVAVTAATPDSATQHLTYEEWVKLDSPGLIRWVKTLGLLPEEVKDAVDSFESNPDFDGSTLEEMVDGESWLMEMQFPDDFGLLREKLIKAIESLRAAGSSENPSTAAQQERAKERPPEVQPILRARSKRAPPYHQRSGDCCACFREQFCAVHALNNIFCNEEPRLSGCYIDCDRNSEAVSLFTVDHLDAIAHRMQLDHHPRALLNPYRWLSLGNFDAAVIESAVKLLGYRPDIFGKPYAVLDLDSADLPNVAGFIITVSSVRTLSGTHSYCIREVDGYWWRLDGKKRAPVEYPDTTSVFGHLQHIVDRGGTILRIRRAAPNLFAMGVEDVVDLLRSLGLGEPLPYVKRCRDMHIDGFWLSMCGNDELHDGRPMKNPQEPGHNEFQGLMIQFSPHRKLLLERIDALKDAAASSVWLSDSFKTDMRLQSSLTIHEHGNSQPGSSSSWSEAKCVDCIRKAFPFFSVGTAYDVAREFGGENFDADCAIATLARDASLVRAKAARSVLTRHNVKHCGHPTHGKRPLSAPMRRLQLSIMSAALIAALHCFGVFSMVEVLLLRSLVRCLDYISTCATYAQVVMQNLAGGARWVISSPLGAAVHDQFIASTTLIARESERALLMLYRHGPAITVPVVQTELGFWNLPVRFEGSPELMSAVCDAITWQHSGFWLNHPVQCAELFADKEQGFVQTARSAALLAAGLGALRKVSALPEFIYEKLTAAWQWMINHELMAIGTLVVLTCEFLPRISKELAGHIDLHLQVSGAAAAVTRPGDPAGEIGSETVLQQALAVESPDMWVRAAWIGVGVCAHYFIAVGCYWVLAPAFRRFVFDDA